MELRRFFSEINSDEPDSQSDDPDPVLNRFKPKSSWRPPTRSASIDAFITGIKSDLLNLTHKRKRKFNLTKEQYKGINDLVQNDKIVIKKADKGSAVVAMNKSDYLREGYRQPSDANFYKKIENDPTEQVASDIKNILSEMLEDELITEKNFDFFTKSEFSESRFYLLPKIHKKGAPGRPIYSSVTHPTCQVSKLIDAYM